jgi:hypothetical protein
LALNTPKKDGKHTVSGQNNNANERGTGSPGVFPADVARATSVKPKKRCWQVAGTVACLFVNMAEFKSNKSQPIDIKSSLCFRGFEGVHRIIPSSDRMRQFAEEV